MINKFVQVLKLYCIQSIRFFKLQNINQTPEQIRLTQMIAELLRGRRPREWSPIVIRKGVLVIFYGHGKRNGSRARAPYIHTYIRTYVAFHDILTWGNFRWKSRDEGKETEIENNNGKEGETPLKNSVKHPVKQSGNENEKDEGTVQQRDKGN